MPKTFWIASLIAFVNAISFTILIPNLYPFAKSFGLTDFQAGLLSSIFAISQFFANPVIGRLSDRYGRKPLLIVSLFGTFLANLLSALAPTAGVLFFTRFLDGITGGNMSVAQAIISDTTKEEDRAKGFGIFMGSFSLGFVIGPALSILASKIPTFWGITTIGMSFVLSAIFALLATLLTLFLLPETNQNLSTEEVNLFDLKLKQLFTAFTMPKVGWIFSLNFLSGLGITIFTFSFQPYFLNTLGQNQQTLAIVFTMFGLIGIVSQFFLKTIVTIFKLLPGLIYSLLVRTVVFLIIPFLPNLYAFIVLLFVLSWFNSIPQSIIPTMLSKISDPKKQGEIVGINSSYLSISKSIGPAIGGMLVGFSYKLPFLFAGFLTLLTAVVAFYAKDRLKELT